MRQLASVCLLYLMAISLAIASQNGIDSALLKNKKFAELRDMLPLYEAAAQHPWPSVPADAGLLKIGSSGQAVLILRQRLRRTEDLTAANDTGSRHFDRKLAEAVKMFQWRHGLKPDGVVGSGTIAELNVPPDIRVQQILINMQRWANLSDHLGDRYIFVNIPDYQMHVIDHGKQVLSMKVIVGRPERQTPELTSRITRLVLNPYWNVPELIANKDIIPKVIENPSYLDDSSIRVYANDSDGAREIDPSNIDWESAEQNGFNYHFRQDPGQKNSLGLVKFEFPNSYSVYMHDTPAKNLFDKEARDLSSGCVRLEHPFELLNYLTDDVPGLSSEKVSDIIDEGKTRYYKVSHPIPVIITYITAWVDDNGIMHFRDDIYQKDFPPSTASEQGQEPESVLQ